MAYQAVEEIQNRCEKESIPFWKAVQLEDCEENGITEEESWQQMTLMWTRMISQNSMSLRSDERRRRCI